MIFLLPVFMLIGISSVLIGLGGGTSYLMFMELFQLPVQIIPVIALSSNVIVSGIGAGIRLWRREPCSFRLLAIILLPSISCAWLGARLGTSLGFRDGVYRLLLNTIVLLIILMSFFLQYRTEKRRPSRELLCPHISPLLLVGISALIGLSSGLVGIGGGIILGPILYLSGMSYLHIPIVTAIYIFINSVVGIGARLPHIVQNFIDIVERAEGSFLQHSVWTLPLLPLTSALSSILTMRFVAYRVSSNGVKLLVMLTVGSIAVYNMIRLALDYG